MRVASERLTPWRRWKAVCATGLDFGVRRLRAGARAVSLEIRFVAFSFLVLLGGALSIGTWVARTTTAGVLAPSATTSAVYAESFLGPLVQGVSFAEALPPEIVARLDGLFAATPFANHVVSFKLWAPDGTLRYSRDANLIGRRFAVKPGLARAARGEVASHISTLQWPENEYEATRWTSLIETYVPIWSPEHSAVVAVMEFYERPDDLLAQVQRARLVGWLIVAMATLVMFLILIGMVHGASRTIRGQNATLTRLTAELRSAATGKVVTDEAVLRRLSQDLHDGPAQHLALASLRIGPVLDATRDTPAGSDADRIAAAIDLALSGVREIAGQLRLPDLTGLPLSAIVALAAEEHERRTGEVVDVVGTGGWVVPRASAATTIYRVVAESLSNAARHAGSGPRAVAYTCAPNDCRVRIEDAGRGFDAARTAEGLGLRGMRERATVVGGALDIRSRPGEGTSVVLTLPRSAL